MQSTSASRIRIISGSGRYTDPWHPFADTSRAIAEIARDLGHDVELVDSEPESLTELAGVDLVVINVGGNPKVTLDPDPAWARSFATFGTWLTAGNPVLGVHTASNAFPDWSAWPSLLGGQWIRGRSMHPERSEFTFLAAPGAADHPALGGLTSVTAFDERYSYLDVQESSTPLLQQGFEDVDHVMGWVRTVGQPAIYDGLGHGPESYESADRRHLLAAEISWLLDPTDGGEPAQAQA